MVSPDGPVGIDVEAVDDRALDTERIGFTAAEHRLLDVEAEAAASADDAHARTTALVRFWAAKEAVAKARGTGFLGNPRNFEVTGKTGDVLDIVTDGDRYQATTQTHRRSVGHLRRGLDHPSPHGGSRNDPDRPRTRSSTRWSPSSSRSSARTSSSTSR